MAVRLKGVLRSLGQNSSKFEGVFTSQLSRNLSRTMAREGEEYIVGHDDKNHEFFIQLKRKDGDTEADRAILQYDFIGERQVDLYHTYVPDAFRGKGIAKILAKEAFDHVVKENLKMHLSCTYLQKYYRDNQQPEYSKRVLP